MFQREFNSNTRERGEKGVKNLVTNPIQHNSPKKKTETNINAVTEKIYGNVIVEEEKEDLLFSPSPTAVPTKQTIMMPRNALLSLEQTRSLG